MLDERKFRAMGWLLARLAQSIASDTTSAVNDVIDVAPLMPVWSMGVWEKDSVLTYNDIPYRVLQQHDSTGNPSWTPDATPALFAPLHATDAAHALPYCAPTHAGDAYNAGEYVIYGEDVYLCKQDATVWSPDVLPSAWELCS